MKKKMRLPMSRTKKAPYSAFLLGESCGGRGKSGVISTAAGQPVRNYREGGLSNNALERPTDIETSSKDRRLQTREKIQKVKEDEKAVQPRSGAIIGGARPMKD